jgi:DNA (cytosine-5)-methyltransferase 1
VRLHLVPRLVGTVKYGSVFSGIEGIGLGLDRAGMTCAWHCEIDDSANKVLDRHFDGEGRYYDVKELGRGATSVDVLTGGFPCQDVSVAGKRAGLAGERSGLFFEFMRVAGEIAPTWVLLENVPGLLSSNAGADMGAVLGTLADLGYGWAYRVLDAQYFGVAQRRRRVFIVGCLGDPARAAKVLFESESSGGDPAPSQEEGMRIAALTANGVGTCGADDNQGQALIAFHQTQNPISEEELSPALGATSSGMGVAFAESQRGELVESEISHQLTTGGGKPGQGYPAVRQGMAVRRLTPKECERLQGFPDGWTDELADGARYRTLGNAVCVPVAEWIGRRIMEAAGEV